MITLAMIVKDEEETLPYCLKSIIPFAEKAIIVDTGSSDNTCDIVRSFGADLHHFDWINDFSAARNYAMSFVQTPWMLWLDADDIFLNPHLLDVVAQSMHKKQVSGIYGDYLQDEYTTQKRMFLCKPKDWKWEGVVHEGLVPRRFAHSGFSNLLVKHRKPQERRIPAAKAYLDILLEKDPRNYMHLAESYKLLGVESEANSDKAIDNYWMAAHYGRCKTCDELDTFYLDECLHCGGKDYEIVVNDGTRYIAMCNAARICLDRATQLADKEGVEYALKVAQLAKMELPERAEAYTLIGEIYYRINQLKEAKGYYEKALACPEYLDVGVSWPQFARSLPETRLKNIESKLNDRVS